MKTKKYAVASTLINFMENKINMITDLRLIEAFNENEAVGIYVDMVNKQFPNHNVNAKPIAFEI